MPLTPFLPCHTGGLPAPAHLLCAAYFVSLLLCAVLLHGLTVVSSLVPSGYFRYFRTRVPRQGGDECDALV